MQYCNTSMLYMAIFGQSSPNFIWEYKGRWSGEEKLKILNFLPILFLLTKKLDHGPFWSTIILTNCFKNQV